MPGSLAEAAKVAGNAPVAGFAIDIRRAKCDAILDGKAAEKLFLCAWSDFVLGCFLRAKTAAPRFSGLCHRLLRIP